MNSVTESKRNNSNLRQWNSYFDLDEHTIRVSGSNLSGREYVYIDDVLVTKKLNWTFKSVHSISLDGEHYEITIELLSILKPKIHITLCKEGNKVDEDFIFIRPQQEQNPVKQIAVTLILLGLGMICGYQTASWLLGN